MRSLYVTGEMHGEKICASTASSRAHSNVTPWRLEVKVNVALLLSVGSAGLLMIAVSGIGVTLHWYLAGLESTVPAEFLARTSSSWVPGRRFSITCGDTHDPNVAPSRAHSNPAAGSSEESAKVAVELMVGSAG